MSGKPLVVFVPSIFGSHLRDAGGRIWVDEDALAAGGLGRLAMTSTVAPDGATAAIYRFLVDALEADYEVNAFDYDWRQPIDVSAALIRGVMLEAAKEEGRRVHLVGHGWGGLVAVAAAADPDVVSLLNQRQGRIIALGAPFAGSWEIQRMLDGSHSLSRMLAKIAKRTGLRPEDL